MAPVDECRACQEEPARIQAFVDEIRDRLEKAGDKDAHVHAMSIMLKAFIDRMEVDFPGQPGRLMTVLIRSALSILGAREIDIHIGMAADEEAAPTSNDVAGMGAEELLALKEIPKA